VAENPGSPAYPIRSVDNALRILAMLQDRPSLGVTDTAADLGVAPSTAHRLLAMLVHRGFASHDPVSRRYHAGERLWEIGVAAFGARSIDELAAPHLARLRDETGETVHLMMLEGDQIRFVGAREGIHSARERVRVGIRLPAYATSGGKYLLAHLRPEVVDTLFPPMLSPLTENTVGSIDALKAELARVRRRGYATNFGESEQGLIALAVGVWGPLWHPVAAIALAGPGARLARGEMKSMLLRVRHAAAGLTEELGGRTPAPFWRAARPTS
jgi:IclR family acetate operon transcriptional repressor